MYLKRTARHQGDHGNKPFSFTLIVVIKNDNGGGEGGTCYMYTFNKKGWIQNWWLLEVGGIPSKSYGMMHVILKFGTTLR